MSINIKNLFLYEFPSPEVSEQIDFNAIWPSSYADGGKVGWSTARSGEDGTLNVSFPDIRYVYLLYIYAVNMFIWEASWASIRATEGWASLQHHSVLHTTITIHPPQSLNTASSVAPPRLLVDLSQGSFFALLPSRSNSLNDESTTIPVVPQWYSGNIYAIDSSSPQTVPLPEPPSHLSPTTYDLFVSGDYEVRIFRPGYMEQT